VDDGVGTLLEELLGLLCGGAHKDVVKELLEEFGAVDELFQEGVRDVGDAHFRVVTLELGAGALVSDLVDADALVFELKVDLEGLNGFAAHLLGDVRGDENDLEGGCGSFTRHGGTLLGMLVVHQMRGCASLSLEIPRETGWALVVTICYSQPI